MWGVPAGYGNEGSPDSLPDKQIPQRPQTAAETGPGRAKCNAIIAGGSIAAKSDLRDHPSLNCCVDERNITSRSSCPNIQVATLQLEVRASDMQPNTRVVNGNGGRDLRAAHTNYRDARLGDIDRRRLRIRIVWRDDNHPAFIRQVIVSSLQPTELVQAPGVSKGVAWLLAADCCRTALAIVGAFHVTTQGRERE